MISSLKLSLRILSLLFVYSTGCGLLGGGEPSIPRAKGYQVSAPAGWKLKETGVESDTTYTLPSGNVATVTSSCNRPYEASPEVLTRQLLIGTRNISFDKRERMTVNGVEGLFSSVKASADGRPLYMQILVLSKKACVFDFTLVSPKQISENESQEFLGFVRRFKYGND